MGHLLANFFIVQARRAQKLCRMNGTEGVVLTADGKKSKSPNRAKVRFLLATLTIVVCSICYMYLCKSTPFSHGHCDLDSNPVSNTNQLGLTPVAFTCCDLFLFWAGRKEQMQKFVIRKNTVRGIKKLSSTGAGTDTDTGAIDNT